MTDVTTTEQDHLSPVRVPPMPVAPPPPVREAVEIFPIQVFGENANPNFVDFRPSPVGVEPDPKEVTPHLTEPHPSPPSSGSPETLETTPGLVVPSVTQTPSTDQSTTPEGGSSSPSLVVPKTP